jgi:hypothetical protein
VKSGQSDAREQAQVRSNAASKESLRPRGLSIGEAKTAQDGTPAEELMAEVAQPKTTLGSSAVPKSRWRISSANPFSSKSRFTALTLTFRALSWRCGHERYYPPSI